MDKNVPSSSLLAIETLDVLIVASKPTPSFNLKTFVFASTLITNAKFVHVSSVGAACAVTNMAGYNASIKKGMKDLVFIDSSTHSGCQVNTAVFVAFQNHCERVRDEYRYIFLSKRLHIVRAGARTAFRRFWRWDGHFLLRNGPALNGKPYSDTAGVAADWAQDEV